jgi:hypothetical protein
LEQQCTFIDVLKNVVVPNPGSVAKNRSSFD